MDEIQKLKQENERLTKINDIKSDLISISAHQLRTTLSAVKWILKMFIDKDFGTLSGEQEVFIQKAYDSNERMVKLVNEMLTLNHTEDTELSYSFVSGNIVEITESVLFDFIGEAKKTGIEIIFPKPTESLPNVLIDTEKIRVVIQNLIENAIKYSNHGDKVFVSIRQKDNDVEISIKDMGIGIEKEDNAKIFGKFFRAENAKKKDSIGSGLGLFTVKTIIEKHEGSISFESTPNEGTIFSFTLPVKNPNIDLAGF
jgi:signal transduction histidine kinase